MMFATVTAIFSSSTQTHAQTSDIRLRSAVPLASPVVDSDAHLRGNRAKVWQQDGDQMILLDRDVEVEVGSYGFRARRALIRIAIDREEVRLTHHLYLYLDNATALPGKGPTQIESPRLLVTVSTTGKVGLMTDLLVEESAEADPLVVDAQNRIDLYLARVRARMLDIPPDAGQGIGLDQETKLADRERLEQIRQQRLAQTGTGQQADGIRTTRRYTPPREQILPPTGTVSLTFDRMVVEGNGNGSKVAMLFGNVGVMFYDPQAERGVSLTAQNAVIFIEPDGVSGNVFNRLDAGSVRGVYLEQNVVATDGQYTIRAPRVYYDPPTNRALVLDAVMYTWDAKRQVPIYVRAERIMQDARDSWKAERAVITTSEFAVPHFAIATSEVTLHEVDRPDGTNTIGFVAEGNSAQWNGKTLTPLPTVAGQATDLPIKKLEPVGFNSRVGFTFRSTWDVYALLGLEKPEGVSADLDIDVRGDHGPAVGLQLNYEVEEMFGTFESYLLVWDEGDDEIGDRLPIDHDDDQRGYFQWQHRQYLDDGWELSLEAAFVSDETFLEELFPDEAELSKQYETSLYLKKQENDWAFTFLAKTDLNDFVAQTTTFQSPGYVVDKLPELTFHQIGTSIWKDRLTYYTENRVGALKIRPGRDTFSDRGFAGAFIRVPGGAPIILPAGTRWQDIYPAANDTRLRFDTRHEVQAPMKIGTVNVVPYGIARFTAYDDDFGTIHPSENENFRIWGAVGSRFHTEFSRVFENVDSRLFDVHQIRHIIEPYADVFYADTTIDQEELFVFDNNVENIREGLTTAFGIRNTLQTKRGGPGRWRSVDWLVADTQFVFTNKDVFTDPFGGDDDLNRYYGYRPEYSVGGNHIRQDIMWLVSNNLSAAADLVYDLEAEQLDQWRVGLNLQHAPNLTSFIDYVDLDVASSRLLRYGFDYQLTAKYNIYFAHTLDLAEGGSRSIELAVVRKLPRWRMIFLLEHDEVDSDTTVGVRLIPIGIGGSSYTRNHGKSLFE